MNGTDERSSRRREHMLDDPLRITLFRAPPALNAACKKMDHIDVQ